MHLLVRETRTLDDAATAVDPGITPADVLFLSFSDSDLGAAAAAWRRLADPPGADPQGADPPGADPPGLRLVNLATLRHPMSVDLLVEQAVTGARCVVVRLLGGVDYWRYGIEEVAHACRTHGIALAVVPGDGRPDDRLAELSTVAPALLARCDGYLREGGVANLEHLLRLGAHLAGRGEDGAWPVEPVPPCGEWQAGAPGGGRPAVIVFYRSQLLAGDTAPLAELAQALAARGMAARLIYVTSLKAPGCAAFVADALRRWRPVVVLNATLFSARSDEGGSPLDAAGVPVLQLIMAGTGEAAWRLSARGLTQADLAMQVVLPEIDGRLSTTAISFKAAEPAIAGLEYARLVHAPCAAGIALAADRAAGWVRLAATPPAARRVALVLSDYPGGQTGHAVGLDSFASVSAIMALLCDGAYRIASGPPVAPLLCTGPAVPFLSLARYDALFAELPAAVQDRVTAAWGPPASDPAVLDGCFALRWHEYGALIVAVQPDRGSPRDRRAGYHDPDTPPRHAYVAFYLWLRRVAAIDAMVHLGTHGTLEWLPGKAVASSETCFAQALVGGLPVIYPFIVNNPGEAACAKRRLGAVTIGHLTPALLPAGGCAATLALERLIDEYAAADGLDRRRAELLRGLILEQGETTGLLAESGVAPGTPDEAALARLDAYLCDVKTLLLRDGLHVFGVAADAERRAALADGLARSCPDIAPDILAARLDASAPGEAAALLAALDGRFVAPGPAGAPTRGRADVLPTGRNLSTIDPRAVPTPAAMTLAGRAAAALLRRHRQDCGDWPRHLVIDLWGSASLRNGGEDFALALILLGARPLWDGGSNRVTGVEILPLALLDRPRVDVTLRISGLFRDAFEAQILLFDEAVRAIAARDEAAAWNPLAAARDLPPAHFRLATRRVFGPPAGGYGAGPGDLLASGAWHHRDQLADAYLTRSGHAYGLGVDGVADRCGFAARVAAADSFLHQQDHGETDLLDSAEYAAHEGGFAAAAASLGGAPALYHGDTSRPEAPVMRGIGEEVVRVVRGRAANPAWIAGMMRHGASGAAEITRALDGLHGFAATLPQRFDRQFDLVFDATLGNAAVAGFLAAHNRPARDAMAGRFAEALRRDLWRPRRNDVGEVLA